MFTCAAPAAGVGCCEAHVTLALRRGAASRSRFALCAGPVRPRRRRAPRAQSTHARAQTTAQHRTANRSGARTATRWAYSSVAPPPPGVSERPHSTWPASTKLQAPTTLGCDAHRRQGRAGAPALPPPTFQVLHQQQRRPPGGGDGSARSAERRRQRGSSPARGAAPQAVHGTQDVRRQCASPAATPAPSAVARAVTRASSPKSSSPKSSSPKSRDTHQLTGRARGRCGGSGGPWGTRRDRPACRLRVGPSADPRHHAPR